MEDNKTFLARLIFEALDRQVALFALLAGDLSSVTVDGEVDLFRVAQYLLERGVQIVG